MRNVRNWWITSDVEGRKSRIDFGPKSKDGGFAVHVYQRVNGSPKKVATMNGFVNNDTLILEFTPWQCEGATVQYDMPHFMFRNISQTRIKSER